MESKIYEIIRNLAINLTSNSQCYTRADLAYYLKDRGVDSDSDKINDLVWDSYIYYNKDNRIRTAYWNNQKTSFLVDEDMMQFYISQRDNLSISKHLRNSLSNAEDMINKLMAICEQSMDSSLYYKKNNIFNTIIGNKVAHDVQYKAIEIFERYKQLIDLYEDSKHSIEFLIHDFVTIRGYISDIYRRYSLLLTDIFGDKIKCTYPELFDFDTIQWLDTLSMSKAIEMDFTHITQKCGALISVIGENFANSIRNASTIIQCEENSKVRLILVGAEILNHYYKVSEVKINLERQLLQLKDSVTHDNTLIKGDLGRLSLIYNAMNDLHIPRAQAYYQYSQTFLDSDFQKIAYILYSRDDVVDLKVERDALLCEYNKIENQIADNLTHINYYTNSISDKRAVSKSIKDQYEEASRVQPNTPFFVLNWFTLGYLQRKYNRDIAEWNSSYGCCVKKYQELLEDVVLDNAELEIHKKSLINNRHRIEQINIQLKESSSKILHTISTNDSVKAQLIPHVESIINLLHIAKIILSTKIDETLCKKVDISDFRNKKLPLDVQTNIKKVVHALAEEMKSYNNSLGSSVTSIDDNEDELIEENDTNMTIKYNEIIDKTANVFDSWLNLYALREQHKITLDCYKLELNKLQSQFNKNSVEINNKNMILREALKKIHAIDSPELVREGLIALGYIDGQSCADINWNDFFEGKFIIEI